jgi:hypothetical protein
MALMYNRSWGDATRCSRPQGWFASDFCKTTGTRFVRRYIEFLEGVTECWRAYA